MRPVKTLLFKNPKVIFVPKFDTKVIESGCIRIIPFTPFNPIPHLMGWSPPHFDFECFPLLQRLKLLGGNQMTIKNKVFAKSGCHFFYDSLSKTMKKSNFKLPRQKFWSFLGNFHQLVV